MITKSISLIIFALLTTEATAVAQVSRELRVAQAPPLLPLELPGARSAPNRQPSGAPSVDLQRVSPYSVEGIALGAHVVFDSAMYREYKCEPSEQFSGFTTCRKVRDDHNKRGKFKSSSEYCIQSMARSFT
jgi:hypothetical protein